MWAVRLLCDASCIDVPIAVAAQVETCTKGLSCSTHDVVRAGHSAAQDAVAELQAPRFRQSRRRKNKPSGKFVQLR